MEFEYLGSPFAGMWEKRIRNKYYNSRSRKWDRDRDRDEKNKWRAEMRSGRYFLPPPRGVAILI